MKLSRATILLLFAGSMLAQTIAMQVSREYVQKYRAIHDCSVGTADHRQQCTKHEDAIIALLTPGKDPSEMEDRFRYTSCMLREPQQPEQITACAAIFRKATNLWTEANRKSKK